MWNNFKQLVLMTLALFISSNGLYATDHMVTKLEKAILEVKRDLILGSWTSYSDMSRTDGEAYDASDMARHEYKNIKTEQGWVRLRSSEMEFALGGTFDHLMERVGAAKAARAGVCAEEALLLLHNIWSKADRYPEVNRIEVVCLKKFRHVFVLVNRQQNSSLADYKTWGDEAYIADPWGELDHNSELLDSRSEMGLPALYPANEYLNIMRKKLPVEIQRGLKIERDFSHCEPFHLVRDKQDVRRFINGIITIHDLGLVSFYDIRPKQDCFNGYYKDYLRREKKEKPKFVKTLPVKLSKEIRNKFTYRELLQDLLAIFGLPVSRVLGS